MNIYYNQPVLSAIAGSLHVTSAAAAWVSTITQLGYATGSAFPATDRRDSVDRKTVDRPDHTVVCRWPLSRFRCHQNLAVMLLSSFGLGFTSVAPQLVVALCREPGYRTGSRKGGCDCV